MYMYLGCAVLLCLVCLFDLACFFLSSLINNMYMYTCVYYYIIEIRMHARRGLIRMHVCNVDAAIEVGPHPL